MKPLKIFFAIAIVLVLASAGAVSIWARQPIIGADHQPIEFAVKPGSGVREVTQQIANAGVPVNPLLLAIVARATGKGAKMKAGSYELHPGATPLKLIDQLARGEFAQEAVVVIEGWTFKQMRQTLDEHPALKHDTARLSDQELLAKVATEYKDKPTEGLFFPDTYLFAKGSSDLQIYKQAHASLVKRLNDAWSKRDASLPYKSPYDALIMASIIEKETGLKSEHSLVSGVFVNRLKLGMLLQTDPTVIYGMGSRYQGTLKRRDLETDTPYNTYTRSGLPPSPIALPGAASLAAALNPAKTDAIYFVSRKDGSSEFSSNLLDHNRAVNKYQRQQ